MLLHFAQHLSVALITCFHDSKQFCQRIRVLRGLQLCTRAPSSPHLSYHRTNVWKGRHTPCLCRIQPKLMISRDIEDAAEFGLPNRVAPDSRDDSTGIPKSENERKSLECRQRSDKRIPDSSVLCYSVSLCHVPQGVTRCHHMSHHGTAASCRTGFLPLSAHPASRKSKGTSEACFSTTAQQLAPLGNRSHRFGAPTPSEAKSRTPILHILALCGGAPIKTLTLSTPGVAA